MAHGDDLDELADHFRWFATSDCSELPVYRAITEGAADDRHMLALLHAAEPGQRRPVLLLAAVHDLLLGGASGEVARWYPTVNGGSAPPTADPYPAFRTFVDEHRSAITELLATRSTQTNEVNRSCLWFVAGRAATADLADQPIAVIEVGASAGLNLGFDRYRYSFTDRQGDDATVRRRGDADSAVELAASVTGHPPIDAPLPRIAARFGLDRQPVDVTDDAATRWLEACVWPEQPIRHTRFRAAVAQARRDPPTLIAGDAVDDLAAVAALAGPDAHLLIVNSWTLTYLDRSRRAAFIDAVDALGRRQPTTWISAEHPTCLPLFTHPRAADPALVGSGHTVVGMCRWRDGRAESPEVIACVHPHLHWMEWFDAPLPGRYVRDDE